MFYHNMGVHWVLFCCPVVVVFSLKKQPSVVLKGGKKHLNVNLFYMYEVVTLHLGTAVLSQSTPCSPGKPFQPTRADPDQPDNGRSPSLQCETGPLTSGPLVGLLGHCSRQLCSRKKRKTENMNILFIYFFKCFYCLYINVNA